MDALRGIAVAAMLLVNDPGDWTHVYAPLRHAGWEGCTPADLVSLPIFGLPGWFPGNDGAAFYADQRYFRPFRKAART